MKALNLRALSLLAAVVVVLAASPSQSYVFDKTSSGGVIASDHWFSTPTWVLNPSRGSNISGSRTLLQVAQAAFATWASAPNAVVVANFGGTTAATIGNDGNNTLCFNCGNSQFTSSPGTLATTLTTTNTSAGSVGQLLDADIVFNPSIQYTTDCVETGNAATGFSDSASCPDNNSTFHDLQTVLTHEIGHFFGLSHSGVVRAVMFPYSPPVEQSLGYDDVAAMSLLYPKGTPDAPTGSITGNVMLGSSPVFGAHVFADSTTSALYYSGFNIRKTPVASLTITDGTYRIDGLPPDSYTVTAEPLDLPVVNSDISDYAKAYGQGAVQTNFTTRQH